MEKRKKPDSLSIPLNLADIQYLRGHLGKNQLNVLAFLYRNTSNSSEYYTTEQIANRLHLSQTVVLLVLHALEDKEYVWRKGGDSWHIKLLGTRKMRYNYQRQKGFVKIKTTPWNELPQFKVK